ncbi:MAG TPA: hypothetical protein EYQ54_15650 [Myxococcales bacterium]|nr:hypothetical protein [Myxococcales bacterium]
MIQASRAGVAFFLIAALALVSAPAMSQQTPGGSINVESTLGVYVYPKAKQDAATQASDSRSCYDSAKERTGIDPTAPPPPVQPVAKQRGGAVKGAAGGAARGAAIGAIFDEAGDGAAAGAVGGAMRGRRGQRKAHAAAEEQAVQQAKAAGEERKETFNRAFSACMDARDYSVQ